MLNRESIDAVRGRRSAAALQRPDHARFGFAQLPGLIRSRFGGARSPLAATAVDPLAEPVGPESVVLFLIDGLGWSLFERFAGHRFAARVLDEGVVTMLTTQFPSTTAAHVTTLHTGRPVWESGVFEWYYFEPLLDAIFSPLLHARLDDAGLVDVPATAGLFPESTLYEELAARGVTTHCHQPARYARSTYSAAVTRGAQLHPYVSFPEALVHLGELIARADGPAYHAVYLDVVDALSHRHGPSSPHVDAELRSLFAALADELPRVLGARGRRTLALLTADHGQIAVDPARTVYVDDRVPALSRWLRRASDGRPLVPGGSPRDLFLYVQPGRVDEARSALERALADCATVHASAELFEAGVFGPSPSPRLRARVGDLLILPRANEMVFWRGDGRFVQSKRGHHGGMSAEEMEIPLLAWRPGA